MHAGHPVKYISERGSARLALNRPFLTFFHLPYTNATSGLQPFPLLVDDYDSLRSFDSPLKS
jgi:hypothetical protein